MPKYTNYIAKQYNANVLFWKDKNKDKKRNKLKINAVGTVQVRLFSLQKFPDLMYN